MTLTLAPPQPAAPPPGDVAAGPVAALPVPDMSGQTECNSCTHPRKSHSRIGCLHDGKCVYGCTVTYMEL